MYTVHARSKICPCVPPCTPTVLVLFYDVFAFYRFTRLVCMQPLVMRFMYPGAPRIQYSKPTIVQIVAIFMQILNQIGNSILNFCIPTAVFNVILNLNL